VLSQFIIGAETMIAQGESLYLDPEKYLELEKQHLVKHEYRDGQIYAMAGASDAHVTIAGNIFAMRLSLKVSILRRHYRIYIKR